MPVILEGDHICEKCKQKFDWIYFEHIRSKLGVGLPVAETMPTAPKAYRVEITENNTYRIYINCPCCGYENTFIYDNE